MFGGPDDFRRLMSGDNIKPTQVSETLARFGSYFKPYWPVLVFVAFLVVVATWAQVTIPELTGQLVDCYLAPTGTTGFQVTPGSDGSARGSHLQLLAGARAKRRKASRRRRSRPCSPLAASPSPSRRPSP